MANLILPNKVTIQLTDNREIPLAFPNALFTVCLFARHKNDFHLGPYISTDSGLVEITQSDLQNDIDSTYESGLMDYVSVETCFPFVEIRLDHPDDIDRAIKSRTEYWTSLLKGEKKRWGNMQNLLNAYYSSTNSKLQAIKGFSRIRDEWGGSKIEYNYKFMIQEKA